MLKVSSTTDEPIIAIDSSPIYISPLKVELDDPDMFHDVKQDLGDEEIVIISSEEEDDFTLLPVKQEPSSLKIKKKKKCSSSVSSLSTPSPATPDPSTSKSRKRSGDKHVIALEVTTEGRVLCYKGCGKSFSKKYNMVKHVRDEVCMKDVMERSTNFTCKFRKCNYSSVMKNALMMHYFSHLKIKAYACEVVSCGKGFIHASSLMNQKHRDHKDIYGPGPCYERNRFAEITSKEGKHKKFFSFSSEDDE